MGDHIVYGLIGFLLGGLIGGWAVGSMCGREYRRRIEALQNERDQLVDEAAKTAEKGLLARQRAIVEAENDLVEEKTVERPVVKSRAKEFAKLSAEYKSEAFDTHFENLVGPDDDEADDIHLIDEDSFKRDMAVKEMAEVVYYQEDGVLADASDEVIPNQLDILGEEAMEIIPDTAEDFLYIDNEYDDMLYKVSVQHELGYYRDVLGLG